MWVEQSYKQIKGALGWAEYHVRADQAIQRHWNLVCCAFTFCWWHASHTTVASAELSDVARDGFAPAEGLSEPNGEKKTISQGRQRPNVSWPVALRQVRAWLEPWIMLRRYWRAWSKRPPPVALQQVLESLWRGNGIDIYTSA
jgi:hypothetical protein